MLTSWTDACSATGRHPGITRKTTNNKPELPAIGRSAYDQSGRKIGRAVWRARAGGQNRRRKKPCLQDPPRTRHGTSAKEGAKSQVQTVPHHAKIYMKEAERQRRPQDEIKTKKPPRSYKSNTRKTHTAECLTGKSCKFRRSPSPPERGVSSSPSPPGSFRPPIGQPAERTSECPEESPARGTTA